MATTLLLTGNTYAIRDSIKAAGWKWDASRKAWTKQTDETVTSMLGPWSQNGYPATPDQRLEVAKRYQGNKKGCQLSVVCGPTIWTSKTFEPPKDHMSSAERAEQRMWNQDGRGHYCKEDDHDAR